MDMDRGKVDFIRWAKQNYLLISTTLMEQINERYENPIAVDIIPDESDRTLHFIFRTNGRLGILSNGTGGGKKVSFTRGKELNGFEHKRYYEIDFKRDYMDMRY